MNAIGLNACRHGGYSCTTSTPDTTPGAPIVTTSTAEAPTLPVTAAPEVIAASAAGGVLLALGVGLILFARRLRG